MPVTIPVAGHNANPVRDGLRATPTANKTSQDVLQQLAHKDLNEIGPILNTALGPQTSITDGRLQKLQLSVQDHGLVRAAYYAYSEHYNLVLRPEDVWFAILTQFSFFINAHSEELRSSFVPHEGKKGLILADPGQPDMGVMCRNMTKLIDENIVDPKLREWILPSFTTTTIDDQVVAAVIMMGTLQKYFDYVFDCTTCGIPTVTLLGEQRDWEDIQRRIEKLSEYGAEPSRFCDMLRPVLEFMVASFAMGPDDAGVVDFWRRIIDRQCGSGMDTLTGWMVAFCFWDEDGKCLADEGGWKGQSDELLGVVYHHVEWSQVPAAFVSVPVTYIKPSGEVMDTKLLAGLIGFEATISVKYPWKRPADIDKDHASAAKAVATLSSLLREALHSLRVRERIAGIFGLFPRKGRPEFPTLHTQWHTAAIGEESMNNVPMVDTLQTVTGWWMYQVRGEETTGMHRAEFLLSKLASDWNGQASTGYVQPNGQMGMIREGLPHDLDP